MAKADIRLVLDGGEAERAWRRYEPGSTVRGTVQLLVGGDVRCDRVVVAIGWHTEGRGDRNGASVGEVELVRGRLTTNTTPSHSFAFRLPNEPWSYAGHYINIVWEVTVTIAIRFARDIKRTEQVVVAPRPAGSPTS